jgi:hypothetical protein
VKSRSYATTPDWFAGEGQIVSLAGYDPQRGQPSGANQSPQCAEVTSFKGTAKLLRFDAGLYSISVMRAASSMVAEQGLALPMTHVSNPSSEELGTVEIVATTGDSSSWLGPEGGTVLLKVPLGGGHALIATYEAPDRLSHPFEIEVRRLDQEASEVVPMTTGSVPSEGKRARQIKLEISLHIERVGDRRLQPDGWVGSRGQRLRLEAFGLRPLDTLAAKDIEYKALGPNGEETPWVTNGQLSGSRLRGLPLTGFAVRLAPHLQDRYEAEYQGAFFDGGVSDTVRAGAPCTSRIPRDPLEAINIRVIERVESPGNS